VVILLVVAAVTVALIVRHRRAGRFHQRGAHLVLAAAAHLFPPQRREWAQAMLTELDTIPGSLARWRFALGGAWTGLVASGREPVPAAGLAVVLAVAGGVGVLAYAVSPVTHVFAVALSLVVLLAGLSSLGRRAAGGTGAGLLGVTLLTGAAACVALTLFGVVTYPAATAGDGTTTVFSLMLAAALGAYMWVGLGGWPAPARREATVAVGLLLGAGWAVSGVVADRIMAIGITVAVGVAGLVVAGTAGARLARRGASERALVAAGLRTGLVAGVAYFVAEMSATYITASWPVHDPAVLDQFRSSGLPDFASYLVSDNLGNSIMALVFLPALVLGITWAGGVLARPRPSPGRSALGSQSPWE